MREGGSLQRDRLHIDQPVKGYEGERMITENDIQAILDSNTQVVGTDGDKIGNVGQVYLDDQSGTPTWVTVKTGLFGSSESFIPVDDATFANGELRVPYTKDVVKDAPRVDADQAISPAEEEELYRYYGGQQGTDYYTPAGAAGYADRDRLDVDRDRNRVDVDRDRTRTDVDAKDGVTLHAEDVDVHTEKRDAGRVRLRKYTVTENVTKTVPVTREEVVVERTPATGAAGAADRAFDDRGGDGEVVAEVDLNQEEVVVDRDVRATEQVNLGKKTHTDERQVTEQVRHEEVAVERDGRDGVVDGDDVRKGDRRI